MIAFLNGRYVSEAEALVPITDRGFLYGDGLFETLRVSRGIPLWWKLHMERLQRGAELLRIALPVGDNLWAVAGDLVKRNALPDAVLRITISRGSGTRGYSTKGATHPTIALTLHPLPPISHSVSLATATIRLPARDPLSLVKSANKLPYILSRAEAEERGADEALLLNIAGDVTEASSSNVFWIERGEVCTPPVSDGALPGVVRSVILDLCRKRGAAVAERSVARSGLLRADAVFLTNSTVGVLPVSEVDAQKMGNSPIVPTLQGWLSEAEAVEQASPE